MLKEFKVANSDLRKVDALLAELVEPIDCIEGCLWDNFLYDFGDKFVACFECYETCWSSGYRILIADKEDDEARSELIRQWETLQSEVEENA